MIQWPPGVGKTHLAVGLGLKAIKQAFAADFYRFDELGFKPWTGRRPACSSGWFYLPLRSILITTNKSVRNWSELIAGDEALTATIPGRLLHNAYTINIKGRSYRLRDMEKTLTARQG